MVKKNKADGVVSESLRYKIEDVVKEADGFYAVTLTINGVTFSDKVIPSGIERIIRTSSDRWIKETYTKLLEKIQGDYDVNSAD